MSQYVPHQSGFQSTEVGGVYHIGLSDGTHSYGYMFYADGQQSKGIVEKTDVATRDALVNYGSPNLTDRDLAFVPRVTQGDFSGGALQEVGIDLSKFFDSDLEVRTPGYLTLRPAWQRVNLAASPVNPVQVLTWNGNTYCCFGEARYYNLAGTQFSGAGINCRFLDTDGNSLLIGDGVNRIKFTNDNSGYSDLATATGAFTGMWLVSQGTNGRFLYYSSSSGNDINTGSDQLFKVDMTATLPVTAGALVPTNLTRFTVIDLVAYQNGIAILTNDPGQMGMDVWYHDGVNMTRIVRVNQYIGRGMTVCLGDIYVTAQSTGSFEGPVLVRIGPGTFDIVVRPANPLTLATTAGIGAPVSSGQYVAFALSNPQINEVTSTGYIGVYDAVTGAYSHVGSLDNTDAPQTGGVPRQLAWSGRALAFAYPGSSTAFTQFQTNSSLVPAVSNPVPLYAAQGWMVTSRLDFSTPGVAKRLRRVLAVHPPLLAGEGILMNGYVDQDQLHNFTVASPPVPSTATVSNTQAGSTSTVLNFGADTVGRTMFASVRLTAGTNQQTSPDIIYLSAEIGGTWTWEFDLDCSSQRLTMQQQPDPQGVTGKDLYFLLRNSYENGNNLTLYLAEGVSYTVAIESLEAQALSYRDRPMVRADEEWRVKAVLRQSL